MRFFIKIARSIDYMKSNNNIMKTSSSTKLQTAENIEISNSQYKEYIELDLKIKRLVDAFKTTKVA